MAPAAGRVGDGVDTAGSRRAGAAEGDDDAAGASPTAGAVAPASAPPAALFFHAQFPGLPLGTGGGGAGAAAFCWNAAMRSLSDPPPRVMLSFASEADIPPTLTADGVSCGWIFGAAGVLVVGVGAASAGGAGARLSSSAEGPSWESLNEGRVDSEGVSVRTVGGECTDDGTEGAGDVSGTWVSIGGGSSDVEIGARSAGGGELEGGSGVFASLVGIEIGDDSTGVLSPAEGDSS